MAYVVLWNMDVPKEGIEASLTMNDQGSFRLDVLRYHDLAEIEMTREELIALRNAIDMGLQMRI